MFDLEVIINPEDTNQYPFVGILWMQFAGKPCEPLQPEKSETADQYRKWLYQVCTQDSRAHWGARYALQRALNEVEFTNPKLIICADDADEHGWDEHLQVLAKCLCWLWKEQIVLMDEFRMGDA